MDWKPLAQFVVRRRSVSVVRLKQSRKTRVPSKFSDHGFRFGLTCFVSDN